MNKKTDFYHGAILSRLIRQKESKISKLSFSSAYLFDNRAIYLKFSTLRVTPWNFTFTKEQIHEIEFLQKQYKDVTLFLLCNEDGLVVLKYAEYRKLISIFNDNPSKWIKASRKKREKYTLTGSDGKLDYKIGENRISEFRELKSLTENEKDEVC